MNLFDQIFRINFAHTLFSSYQNHEDQESYMLTQPPYSRVKCSSQHLCILRLVIDVRIGSLLCNVAYIFVHPISVKLNSNKKKQHRFVDYVISSNAKNQIFF